MCIQNFFPSWPKIPFLHNVNFNPKSQGLNPFPNLNATAHFMLLPCAVHFMRLGHLLRLSSATTDCLLLLICVDCFIVSGCCKVLVYYYH